MIERGEIAADLGRTQALLWSSHNRPVGRSGKSVGDFVAAAVSLVQEQGVNALSMRAVAAKLGVRTMATYSFAPGKADLVALMVDHAYRDLYAGGAPSTADWREGLRTVAHTNRALHLAHPWLQELQAIRSPMGPHEMRKHELELAPIEGIGLTDPEMDQTLSQLLAQVAHAARMENRLRAEQGETGLEDGEWWVQAMPVLERLVDPKMFPLSVRVGTAAAAARSGQFWGQEAFEFGLERLLDGVEVLVQRRKASR